MGLIHANHTVCYETVYVINVYRVGPHRPQGNSSVNERSDICCTMLELKAQPAVGA